MGIAIWLFDNEALLQALGWTLLHVVWQGAVVALLLAVVLWSIPVQHAQRRYLSAVIALACLSIGAAITFWMHYYAFAESTALVVQPIATSWNLQVVSEVHRSPLWTNWRAWLERQLPYLAVMWLVGCLLFALRLFGALGYLWWLRRSALPIGVAWQACVSVLVARAGLRRAVQVARSAQVQMPVAFGLLKPIVLLPAAWFTQLSPKALEAILLHELIHIRRYDFAVRLLQGMVEALFYYHPAVWWISAVISKERECACDDAVVAVLGDRMCYARALLKAEELVAGQPALALGLYQGRSGLLVRIRRIIDPTTKNHRIMERTMAIFLLVVALMLGGYWARSSSELPMTAEPIGAQCAVGLHDTVPEGAVTRLLKVEDGRSLEIEIQGDTVSKVVVDGKVLPPESFGQYRDEAARMRREMVQQLPFVRDTTFEFFAGGQLVKKVDRLLEDRPDSDTLIILGIETSPLLPNGDEPIEWGDAYDWEWPIQGPSMMWRMEHLTHQLAQMEKELERLFDGEELQRRIEEIMEKAQRGLEHIQEEWPELSSQFRALGETVEEWKNANEAPREAEMELYHVLRAPVVRQGSLLEVLEYTLQKDGLIEPGQPWSIEISNRKMKVNGKKMTPGIHHKYVTLLKAHFAIDPSGKWMIRYESKH